jgi:hypothetical protein
VPRPAAPQASARRRIGGPDDAEANLAPIRVAEIQYQAYAAAVVFTVTAMTAATMYSMEIVLTVSHRSPIQPRTS